MKSSRGIVAMTPFKVEWGGGEKQMWKEKAVNHKCITVHRTNEIETCTFHDNYNKREWNTRHIKKNNS